MFGTTVDSLLTAIPIVFQIANFSIICVGVLLGVIVGALPGLSTTMALAVLLPITFHMEPLFALLLLMGVYVGGMFGGSISAILMNIPGTPSSVATAFDGFPMCQQGKAGQAIGFAAVASCIGGLIGAVILSFATPPISNFALSFGYEEYFAIAIFGLSIISSVSGKHFAKGLLGGLIGIFTCLIGLDPITNIDRFTFGSSYLLTGVNLVPLMIGLFGLAEVINRVYIGFFQIGELQKIEKAFNTVKKIGRHLPLILRSSLIGTFMGALPAVGGAVTCIVAYNEAKRTSKHPEEFGKGNVEGIVAAESANNSSVCGAMVPLLTLGIPGDPQTAVLIGAFLIHNLRPGPMLLTNFSTEVYSLFVAFFVASLITLVIGLFGARYVSRILRVPQHIILPIIAALCIIGAYSLSNSVVDVYVAVIFGLVGFIFRQLEIPSAPVILGAMLGSMAEVNLRTALIVSQGSFTIFLKSPIVLFFLIITVLTLLWPFVKMFNQRKKLSSG